MFQKEVLDTINKIAEEQGIKYEDAEHAFEDLWFHIKKAMGDPRMPKIKLYNWGQYIPESYKLKKTLWAAFQNYKNGHITRDNLVYYVQKLWPIINRLRKEEYGKKIDTMKEWKNKIMPNELEGRTYSGLEDSSTKSPPQKTDEK